MQFQFFYKIIVNETYLQIFDYTKSVNKNADNLTAYGLQQILCIQTAKENLEKMNRKKI